MDAEQDTEDRPVEFTIVQKERLVAAFDAWDERHYVLNDRILSDGRIEELAADFIRALKQ